MKLFRNKKDGKLYTLGVGHTDLPTPNRFNGISNLFVDYPVSYYGVVAIPYKHNAKELVFKTKHPLEVEKVRSLDKYLPSNANRFTIELDFLRKNLPTTAKLISEEFDEVAVV